MSFRLPAATAVLLTVAIVFSVIEFTEPAAAEDPVTDPGSYVNPFIGTQTNPTYNDAGMTFPGAVAPFGMVQWSPDTTDPLYGSGYNYDANTITGFSLTHLNGAGCRGLGEIPIMPISGTVSTPPPSDPARYYRTYTHAQEQATPGYYSVQLSGGPRVELTATQRTGTGRFSFPAGAPGTVLFDLPRALGTQVPEAALSFGPDTVTGHVRSAGFCGRNDHYYTVSFSAQFSQPFNATGTWQGGSGPGVHDGTGGWVTFSNPTQPVTVRIGVSFTSEAGAAANRTAESPTGSSFDQIRADTYAEWNRRLRTITVSGGTTDERRVFYTALYHTLIQPNVFSDVDGRYRGFDNQVRQVTGGHVQYANFSGWDTYRSQVQLMTLVAPTEAGDVAQSMLLNTQQIGDVWDRWSLASTINGVMNGDPYHSILASTYAFGGRNFDAAAALPLMVQGATQRREVFSPYYYEERPGLADYLARGYVPDHASDTLEYAVADFGIASLAQALGDQTTYQTFMAKAQSWQSLFNPQTGVLQPRDSSGRFYPNDPSSTNGWVEGSGAHYTWAVPYDRRGLFDAMGGNAAVVNRLDALFHSPDGAWQLNTGWASPHAALGNEPSQHIPWMYDFAGAPYMTQETVRQALLTLLDATPAGLPGNDDLGTTSAWWVWGAMGLFPATPGRSELVLGSPLFTRIVIARPSGQTITINAPAASDTARYVQSLSVNGQPSTRPWLAAGFVGTGGTVDFTLGTTANTAWGSAAADAPPSYRDGESGILTGVGPDRVVVPPGQSGTATLTVRNTRSTAASVSWSATGPSGFGFSPSSGTLSVAANATATRSITVSSTAPQGFYQISVTTNVDGVSRPNGAEVAVGPRNSVFTAMNSRCILPDGGSTAASCDRSGHLYSAQALAAAGVQPGGTLSVNGFTFAWPNQPSGPYDNVVPAGQTIAIGGAAGKTRLSLLGASVEGSASGTYTVTYTDATTDQVSVGLTDWAQSAQFGETLVATMPYRLNNWDGSQAGPTVFLFATAPINLRAGKQVASITLPAATSGGQMHVFAVAAA